jgi:two-component system, NtrC family, sensor kinase
MSGVGRVLIADGSSEVRSELERAFNAAGFECMSCDQNAAALAALRTEPFDVLVLDPQLPDADAHAVLDEVCTNEPIRELVVLLHSADPELRARVGGPTGADDFFAKPCDPSALVARTRELMQLRGETAESQHPVLVIDDSPTFREYLSMTLQEQGYPVVTAVSGEEGLRLAAVSRPSALVVDGVLPGIDGATVIRRVRLDAALRGVPCILLTAAQEDDAELRALDSGADAFVRKDEDPALILAKLAALLRISGGRHVSAPSLLAAKRILTVAHSPEYRERLARVLDEEGHQTILADSGEQAIDLLSRQTVDCILLELTAPGIGGVETCRLIKSSPGLRDVPLIMLTANDDRASMLEVLALGADDCVPKSADLEVLKARMRAQLRRRQFEDETRRAREQLLRSEVEAAAAINARELAEARAQHVQVLQSKNDELETAYRELQATQAQLVQSAKMASLGELVAGVAHEINNPLAFVLSHLDTVQRSLGRAVPDAQHLPAGAKEQWDRAHSRMAEMNLGLGRIRELVVKLRTFSRLDEGERKTVSIRECIDSLLTILGHKLKDRVAVTTHYGEPDELDCFPSLLTQAIMNLVANSVDAIEGSGSIDITTGMAGSNYRIVVTDSGHGIPPQLRERVLEPFFTTKPVGQGTGLGLSICYSIVRKHNGTLELIEAAGGGTQAIISLPQSEPACLGG